VNVLVDDRFAGSVGHRSGLSTSRATHDRSVLDDARHSRERDRTGLEEVYAVPALVGSFPLLVYAVGMLVGNIRTHVLSVPWPHSAFPDDFEARTVHGCDDSKR
jgi:hypothetical protein